MSLLSSLVSVVGRAHLPIHEDPRIEDVCQNDQEGNGGNRRNVDQDSNHASLGHWLLAPVDVCKELGPLILGYQDADAEVSADGDRQHDVQEPKDYRVGSLVQSFQHSLVHGADSTALLHSRNKTAIHDV